MNRRPPLVEARQVLAGLLPAELVAYERPLRVIVDWAGEYLCRPHPELGRRGHVCPYTRSALTAGTFHLGVVPGQPAGPDEVAEVLRDYRERFVELEPRDGPNSALRTILVLFPDLLPAQREQVIDGTQRLLKSEYVASGLMLGEFHDGPPDRAGLWSRDFRPLRSPVPLLAIRHMVPTDLAFLEGDEEHLAAYLARFADQVPSAMRSRLVAAMAHFGLGLPPADAVGVAS